MITEDYVNFETAKLLKEKRFPQSTFRCHYIIDGNINYKSFENRCGFGDYDIIAPTLAMAMKWLREVHNIHIEIFVIKNYDKKICEYTYTIMDLNFPGSDDGIDCCNKYKTYEQACEAAIKYCLKNLI